MTEKEQEIVEAVRGQFGESIKHYEIRRDRRIALTIEKDTLKRLCRYLKEKEDFDHLTSISAVDRSRMVTGMREKQLLYYNDYMIVYHLWSHSRKTVVEIRIVVPRKNPAAPTV
ncbi:MAG: hypothetical protein GTN80_09660, partial [Nitrososphaeria archaeon]|nr:hypothetical protein [Nitrososphaeria archaeon]